MANQAAQAVGFAATAEVVSSESESLILVNSDDEPTGFASKGACHDGDGILHRAFSLFLFNQSGELLLQQRSADKRLWPMYWSNSCCSHPRKGEDLAVATQRRLEQELGMGGQFQYLYKFQYQARFGDLGSEHELCSVFVGNSTDPVQANPTEIAAWRFISASDLDAEMAERPEDFTPWFKMEWQRLKSDFSDQLRALGCRI